MPPATNVQMNASTKSSGTSNFTFPYQSVASTAKTWIALDTATADVAAENTPAPGHDQRVADHRTFRCARVGPATSFAHSGRPVRRSATRTPWIPSCRNTLPYPPKPRAPAGPCGTSSGCGRAPQPAGIERVGRHDSRGADRQGVGVGVEIAIARELAFQLEDGVIRLRIAFRQAPVKASGRWKHAHAPAARAIDDALALAGRTDVRELDAAGTCGTGPVRRSLQARGAAVAGGPGAVALLARTMAGAPQGVDHWLRGSRTCAGSSVADQRRK
jgi:hypothetical protein